MRGRLFEKLTIGLDKWENTELTLEERALLIELERRINYATNHARNHAEFAWLTSNNSLAIFAKISERKVCEILKKLCDLNYIVIKQGGSKARIIEITTQETTQRTTQILRSTTQNSKEIKKVTQKNKEIVSKKVIKKIDNYQAHAYEVESYNDILDNLDVHGIYRLSVFDFIKHLNLNGHKVINSRLEHLIIALDFRYQQDDVAKCVEIRTAITNGYVRLPSEEYNYN